MNQSKQSYLQILRATSIFGGMQFFNILLSVLRTKMIAIFIGPTGMGVITLLNSALNSLAEITGLGIETSAVKHISEQQQKQELQLLWRLIAIVRRMMFWVGLLGALLLALFADVLSQLSFGSSRYACLFAFLSIALLLRQLTLSQLLVFRGLRKLQLMAKAGFYGNLVGLLLCIPLYYYYKIDAILPSIVVTALAAFIASSYYFRKLKIQKIEISNQQTIKEGKDIVKLGLMLSISGVLGLLASYFIQVYIGKIGGLAQVGLYNAGFTLLNSYVGIVFSVMSTDYFPKLSSISNDNQKIKESVIEQSYISVFIMSPIVIMFLTFASFIVTVLFTERFLSIVPMLCFGILGMLFRAVSWSMGFVLIAKGESKLLITTALWFNLLSLVLNVLGYYFYGLEGVGFCFLFYYLLHLVALILISKKRYDFYFEPDFYRCFMICLALCVAAFCARSIPSLLIRYSLLGLIFLLNFGFVLYHLNKKIGLKEVFNSICKKKQ